MQHMTWGIPALSGRQLTLQERYDRKYFSNPLYTLKLVTGPWPPSSVQEIE